MTNPKKDEGGWLRMKLPIKDKYFQRIKSGEKKLEWRDAHITFVNERTKETLRKDVIAICIKHKAELPTEVLGDISFEDLDIIEFELN